MQWRSVDASRRGPRRSLTGWLALPVVLLATMPVASAGHDDYPWWLPGCCREWEAYTTVDSVFMQRDNLVAPRDLVGNSNTSASAIESRDMQFAVAPGVRAFYGQHGRSGTGWEVGYLGVYGMFAEDNAAGAGTLEVPSPLSSLVASLRNASLARTTYGSTLNSAEINFLLTDAWVHLPRSSAYGFEQQGSTATVDWIAGTRWVGLEESASITLIDNTDPLDVITGTYAVQSSSNLIASQIGSRGRIDWDRIAIEGWLKAGLAAGIISQSQAPIVDTVTGFVERDARGSTAFSANGVFDLGGSLLYRIDDIWALRLGYSMICLTGVALAPDQFDFSSNVDAGTAVNDNGTLWMGGGTLGLEARW
jgi:hypothetical protein